MIAAQLLTAPVAAAADFDPLSEEMIRLADVPRRLPSSRTGKKISLQAVYRWSTSGCRGVVLRTIQMGGTRCTTRRWLAEFFAALTARRDGTPTPDRAPPCVRRPSPQTNARLDAALGEPAAA
jgi:hypothetical protein